MRWLVVLAILLVATSAQAADRCWPLDGLTYTLNSNNYTPGDDGIDVRGFEQYLTAQIVKTAGTMNITVEVKYDGAAEWKELAGGPITDDFFGGVNPDQLVIHRVRFKTASCSGCTASLRVCGRSNPQ